MRYYMFVALLGGMIALSGCASTRSAQEIERVKTDVQLLQQRVTQLEAASRAPAPVAAQPSSAGKAIQPPYEK